MASSCLCEGRDGEREAGEVVSCRHKWQKRERVSLMECASIVMRREEEGVSNHGPAISCPLIRSHALASAVASCLLRLSLCFPQLSLPALTSPRISRE